MQVAVSFLAKDMKSNTYKSFMGLRNLTANICKLADGESFQSAVLDLMFDAKKYGNFFKPCPIAVCV